MQLNRRGFISGLIAAVAAPAIVRPGILMPVKKIILPAETLYVGDLVRIRMGQAYKLTYEAIMENLYGGQLAVMTGPNSWITDPNCLWRVTTVTT